MPERREPDDPGASVARARARLDDFLWLYELSAAIGGSLDPEEACRAFARTLLARRNFSYAAFWVRDRAARDHTRRAGYSLLFSTPAVRSEVERLPVDAPAFTRAGDGPGYAVDASDPEFATLLDEAATDADVLTVIRMGNLGWLKLLSPPRPLPERREIAQLADVLARLATSLEGALAHRRLVAETEEREELERQLRHVQKFEAIAQLTSGIAHDFNNILTSVLGFTQLAWLRFGESGNDELDEYLSEIRTAGERARGLVARLHAFNRSRGSERAVLSLADCVRDTLRLLRPMTPSSVELTLEEAPDLPPVLANGDELGQVVMNLCLNACDAVREQGVVTLTLADRRHLSFQCASCMQAVEGDFVALSVKDAGAGIEPAAQARMFDPFFTTKGERGSGLGLSMVHGLVHAHHGHLCVHTAPMAGTVIEVLLPTASDNGAGVVEPEDPATETATGQATDAMRREV